MPIKVITADHLDGRRLIAWLEVNVKSVNPFLAKIGYRLDQGCQTEMSPARRDEANGVAKAEIVGAVEVNVIQAGM
jgi:hypothetical protein